MIRVTFVAFLVALSGPVFAQVPGVTSKTVLLGQSAAFSGPAAQLGIQMNIGTKTYLDYVNARGGVTAESSSSRLGTTGTRRPWPSKPPRS